MAPLLVGPKSQPQKLFKAVGPLWTFSPQSLQSGPGWRVSAQCLQHFRAMMRLTLCLYWVLFSVCPYN